MRTRFLGLDGMLPVRFAVASAAGALLAALAFPLAWLIGPLLASGAVSMFGMRSKVPDLVRRLGQGAAGFAVGLLFTPDVALRAAELGLWMVATGLVSILSALVVARVLARLAICDGATAFLSTMPGGMAEMASVARDLGADTTLVSLAQSCRVVVIVLSLPPLMALVSGAALAPHAAVPHVAPMPLILGLTATALLSLILARLRLFNPWLIGGLLGGIATAMLLGLPARAPAAMTVAAQIAIGTALGTRLERDALVGALRSMFLPATVLATVALILVNVAMAAVFSAHVNFLTGVLAMAPGGIAEMSLTAEALSLAAPLVAAWQLCRILMVALLTRPLYALYRRLT